MATKVSEVVAVKALSKYGFQLTDGSYVNWGKFVKDEDKSRVVPGASYEVEMYISDKGSKSANSIGRQVGVTADVPAVRATAPHAASQVVVKARDFDAEARGKTRCALLQGLLANPSLDLAQIEKELPMIDILVSFVFGDAK